MNEFSGPRSSAGRARAKEATRARILEVAKAELEKKGYEGTNIRGVAEAAGVATGTVILHFADKRELLHSALFGDLEATWHALRDAAPPPRPVPLVDALASLGDGFFRYYAARERLSRALLRESLFAEGPFRERFAGQIAEVSVHVAALVEGAKARAEIAPSFNPRVAAAAFFSFYYFALLAWLQGGHPSPRALLVALLKQHFGGGAPPTEAAAPPLGPAAPAPGRAPTRPRAPARARERITEKERKKK